MFNAFAGDPMGGASAQSKRNEIARLDSPLGTGQYVPPTTRQKLEAQLAALSEAKANVEAALVVLDQNPGAEELLNALRKVNL